MNTTRINSINDLRNWIWNANPGNAATSDSRVDAIQEAIRREAHPNYGSDWTAWLDENAERLALRAVAS
jgi:hypothetical protein